MKKLKPVLIKTIEFFFNPHFVLCFGIGWLITNGWSYIFLGLGTFLGIKWMVTVATAYLAFLWLPGTPEKIVSVIIALWLLKVIFPNDTKTLNELRKLKEKFKLNSKE